MSQPSQKICPKFLSPYFLEWPLLNLLKIMLWKYFQNCMYSIRENWEVNIRICHTVPRFNPQLFTISLKSKVLFQYRSEITWPTVYGSVTWFPLVRWGKVNRTDSSTKYFSLIGSFFFYICYNLSIAQNILPRQQCFILKSVSSFPTSRSSWSISEFLLL